VAAAHEAVQAILRRAFPGHPSKSPLSTSGSLLSIPEVLKIYFQPIFRNWCYLLAIPLIYGYHFQFKSGYPMLILVLHLPVAIPALVSCTTLAPSAKVWLRTEI
jgi:hypothetical protein